MKVILQIGLVVSLFILNGCLSNKTTSNEQLQVKYTMKEDKVNFLIKNRSENEIIFPTIDNYYIEIWQNEVWEKVPYNPCKCGAPCAAPIPKNMASEESFELEWNFLSRKCQGRTGEELILTEGKFQIRFRYQVLANGRIIKNATQWVKFEK